MTCWVIRRLDHKTSGYEEAEGWVSMAGAEMQVRLYTAGSKSGGRIVEEGSVAFLSSEYSKVVPLDVDNSSVEKAVKGAEKVVKNIWNKRFKPNRGKHWDNCDTRGI